jgi:molecular chaperone GrpE
MKKANHNAGGEQKPQEEMNANQQAGGPEAAPEETLQAEAAPDAADEVSRKYDELNDRFLRLYAEYDNYRKRTSKEKEAMYGDCVVQVTAEWLPVVDNLLRAIESASRYKK